MPGLEADFTNPEPEVVPINDGNESGSLPIPDVKNLDMSAQLAELVRQKPELVRRLDDEPIEQPEPRGKRERNPQPPKIEPVVEAAGEATEEEDGKEIVKPWARARVLEKEKHQRDEQIADLQYRINALTEVLQKQVDAAQEKPVEETIDAEVDPVKAILHEIGSLKKEVETIKSGSEEAKHALMVGQAIDSVNATLHKQLGEDPVFKEAIEHMAAVYNRSIEKKYPGTTQDQRAAILRGAMDQEKYRWAREGKDPVQEFYDIAMTYGFDPDAAEARLATTAPAKTEAKPKTAKATKEEIVTRKEKERATASIGGVEGGAPKPFDAGALARAKTTEEFNSVLEQLEKAGVVHKNHGRPGKTPDFATLMALYKGRK